MPTPVQDELPDIELPDIDVGIDPEPVELPEPVVAEPEPERVVPVPVVPKRAGSSSGPVLAEREDVAGGSVMGSPRLVEATVDSRYAGAMLLHGFFDLVGVAAVFTPLTGTGPAPAGSGRFDDVALLTATTVAFALGVGSVEATKHLVRAQLGPLAGLEQLPELWGPCVPASASSPGHVTRCGRRPIWPPR